MSVTDLHPVALGLALAVALAGLAWRVGTWLRRWVGPPGERPPTAERVRAAIAGALGAPFGRALPRLLVAFVLDALLQRRLWRRDPVRWVAHMGVFLGFTGLLLTHALGGVVAAKVFHGHASTVNPWLWLRDLFGLAVAVGLILGVARRRLARAELPVPRGRDPLFVALVAAIVLTGFLLAAVKIVSAAAFARMVTEYSTLSEAEVPPLRAYWQSEYGVAFPPGQQPPSLDAKLLAAGQVIHARACAECHARPQSAFVSYPVSRLLAGVAQPLAASQADGFLFHLHLFLCFLGLAYLPFGRALHLVSAPAALVANAGAGRPVTVNAATRRALALDACTRCGMCDESCSVRALAPLYGNPLVLPAEKLFAMRELAKGSFVRGEPLAELALGSHACTDCGRCTRGCPVGIDLEDLWAAGKGALASLGEPAPAAWVKAVPAAAWAERVAAAPDGRVRIPAPHGVMPRATALTGEPRTFSPCVQCQTCTNVCPVVALSSGAGAVDVTPQKVMNLLRLGMVELALGSRMVWDCATCYQCQESCPAGIRVTEVLYELRNLAYQRLGTLRTTVAGEGSKGGAA
jgi:heterodisulfide reductase subunit C/nitrate reductase gamma subunit